MVAPAFDPGAQSLAHLYQPVKLAVNADGLRKMVQVFLQGEILIPDFVHDHSGRYVGYAQVFALYFNDRQLKPQVYVREHETVLRTLCTELIKYADTLVYSDIMQNARNRRKFFYAASVMLAAVHSLCVAHYPCPPQFGQRNRMFDPRRDAGYACFHRRLAGELRTLPDMNELVTAAQPLGNMLGDLVMGNRAREHNRVRAANARRRGRGGSGGGGGGRGYSGSATNPVDLTNE